MRVPLSLLLGVIGAACTCGGGGGDDRDDGGCASSNDDSSSSGCGADFQSDGATDGSKWGYGGYGASGGYGYGGSGGYGGQGGVTDAAGCPELDGTVLDPDAGCQPVGCVFGHGDCNNDLVTDGCETSLLSDPSDCAGCGHGCGGGACSYASCAGAELVAPSFGSDVTAMTRDQNALYYAVDAQPTIYFVPEPTGPATPLLTLSDRVDALEISGNRLITLGGGDFDVAVYDFSLPVALTGGFALDGQNEALAIDATYVYACASEATDPDATVEVYEGSVVRAPIVGVSGGAPELLFSESGRARAITMDGSALYVAFSLPGRIYAIATDTLAVSLVASGDFDPSRITANGGFVYAADQSFNSILRAPLGGGPLETVLATPNTPFDVRADSGEVWFTLAEPGELHHFADPSLTWLAGLLRPRTPILFNSTHVHYSIPTVGVVRIAR